MELASPGWQTNLCPCQWERYRSDQMITYFLGNITVRNVLIKSAFIIAVLLFSLLSLLRAVIIISIKPLSFSPFSPAGSSNRVGSNGRLQINGDASMPCGSHVFLPYHFSPPPPHLRIRRCLLLYFALIFKSFWD